MRVLMVAATPYFADRGCHVRIQGEVQALERRGHEVLIATYGLGRDVPGGTIRRSLSLPGYDRLDAAPTVGKLVLDLAVLVTTLRLARTFRPDVLHGHTQEGGMIAILVSRLTGVPILLDLQSRRVAEELVSYRASSNRGLIFGIANVFDHAIPRWAQATVTSTEAIAQFVRRETQAEGPIAVLADAVDVPPDLVPFDPELARELGLDPARPIIVYLGLLIAAQGVDLLLTSFRALQRRRPEVQLLLMGYPDVERWRQRADDLGLGAAVSLPGRVEFAAAPRYLSLGRVAVSAKPTLVEGNGKLLLYMACGLPTVALDTATNREVLGPDGVYAADDPEAFADALERTLDAPGDRGALLRDRARREASWDARAAQLERLYAHIAA